MESKEENLLNIIVNSGEAKSLAFESIQLAKKGELEAAEEKLEEAKQVLSEQDGKTGLQAIGYKELVPYFQGNFTLEEAVEHMKRETRRYAKRQLTWFRRNPNIHWLKVDEMESHEQLVEEAKSIVTQFQF